MSLRRMLFYELIHAFTAHASAQCTLHCVGCMPVHNARLRVAVVGFRVNGWLKVGFGVESDAGLGLEAQSQLNGAPPFHSRISPWSL